jgi:hypothetical protein
MGLLGLVTVLQGRPHERAAALALIPCAVVVPRCCVSS